MIYLWGIPETVYLSDKGALRDFEEWRNALNKGNLTHRVWIFKDETLKELRKAYLAVRKGKEPEPIKIDLEPWTLRDIYNYHPSGSNPDFWTN